MTAIRKVSKVSIVLINQLRSINLINQTPMSSNNTIIIIGIIIKPIKIIRLRSLSSFRSLSSLLTTRQSLTKGTHTKTGTRETTTPINQPNTMRFKTTTTGVENLNGEIGTIRTKLSSNSSRLILICTPKTLIAFTESPRMA